MTDRQILPDYYLYLGEKQFAKLQISGSWDQEIDLWFMNRKTLIPSLQALQEKKYYWTLKCLIRGYSAEGNSLGHGGKFPFLVKAGPLCLNLRPADMGNFQGGCELLSYA